MSETRTKKKKDGIVGVQMIYNREVFVVALEQVVRIEMVMDHDSSFVNIKVGGMALYMDVQAACNQAALQIFN